MDEDEDWPPDPQQTHYELYMRGLEQTVRPKDMKVDVVHGTEGPREDPYGWTEYRITMPDGRKATYRHAMLSERLELDSEIGLVTFESPEYPADDRDLPMKVLFEDFVGYGIDQIDYWSNEDYERYADIREAEIAAGWDSSP